MLVHAIAQRKSTSMHVTDQKDVHVHACHYSENMHIIACCAEDMHVMLTVLKS